MIERRVEVINRHGLHARAAAKFVQTANRYSCEIKVSKDGQKVDGKSILGVLMLAAGQGSILRLFCHGSDESAAADALSGLIAERFGEED